jgi:hypothetical protein
LAGTDFSEPEIDRFVMAITAANGVLLDGNGNIVRKR